MEACKAQIEFVEVKAVVLARSAADPISDLNDLELALVGGGTVDVNF